MFVGVEVSVAVEVKVGVGVAVGVGVNVSVKVGVIDGVSEVVGVGVRTIGGINTGVLRSNMSLRTQPPSNGTKLASGWFWAIMSQVSSSFCPPIKGHSPTSIAGALSKIPLGVPRLLIGPVRTQTAGTSKAVGAIQTVGSTKLTGT